MPQPCDASPVEQPKYLVDNDAGLLMESAT
jgi:hypothetical protein